MNVLVTGGAGFIGSNLCECLILQPDVKKLMVVDVLDEYYDIEIKKKNLKPLLRSEKVHFYQEDILNENRMEELLKENEVDTIVHLAAVPGVRNSIDKPSFYVDVDVKGTVSILQAAKKSGCTRLIFASSSSVYGHQLLDRPHHEEQTDPKPLSPYGAAKYAGEVFCETFHRLYQMNITVLRFFTVYGPRQRPDMALFSFAKSIMENREIQIYGNQTARDYTYISDIVEGILLSLKRMNGFQVYNLCSGRTVTVGKMVESLEHALGRKAKKIEITRPLGDVRFTWGDYGLANKMLGYKPRVSWEEGVTRFATWFLQELDVHS
ncbi:GDP-mannose 4,6-dehydratase [Microaerobacter geothermalis]|uniref:GDP-mannose 4,6-dehydratase n=1 Tax=Microaerobacter geothermalis TaxID=674972 RepID=UPI001F48272F|nr:GDP-mannose 4,6-dehydratase [Microaerobacter geothermalis]MCF6095135.1 GDP-mannose 4,6-dehydratase [Microaerobacter geothermalis]